MALVFNSPQDVVNGALVQIGWKSLVGSLYDGSQAAQTSLAIYGETRDEMLREGNWQFAMRNLTMTLLKSAPSSYLTPWDPAVNPPTPWLFEYQYPSDCLKVRAVKPAPIFVPDFDPGPNRFSVDNDSSYNPPQKVILCNVPDALLVYTGQVTDPLTWEPSFTSVLVDRIAEKLSAALATPQGAQLQAAMGARDKNAADMEIG